MLFWVLSGSLQPTGLYVLREVKWRYIIWELFIRIRIIIFLPTGSPPAPTFICVYCQVYNKGEGPDAGGPRLAVGRAVGQTRGHRQKRARPVG